jgi:hypothetical protein
MTWNDREKEFLRKNIKEWNKLNNKQKLEFLQFIENKIADEQERLRRAVKEEYLGSGRGLFDHEEASRVYIAAESLHNDNVYDVINTIIHEGRHAYQFDVVHDIITEDRLDKQTLALKDAWKANNEIYYLDGQDIDITTIEYKLQSTEDDARYFALRKMDELGEFLQDQDKENWERYIQKQHENINKFYDRVRKHHGDDYKENVNQRIQREYTRAEDIRVHAEKIQKLQREINFLEKGYEITPHEPSRKSLERAIQVLKNERDGLQKSLESYGVTLEKATEQLEEYKNSQQFTLSPPDRKFVYGIITLQSEIAQVEQLLKSEKLSLADVKMLEGIHARKTMEHTSEWKKLVLRSNKNKLIAYIERIQKRELTKSRGKKRELEP